MAIDGYLNQSLAFKARKALRYVELYGISRTLAKVRGQYHMASLNGFSGGYWDNPLCKAPDAGNKSVGLIGAGSFAFSNIAYYLDQIDRGCIRAAMDIEATRARSLVARYGGAYATTDARHILQDPKIDLVYISSNHASHAAYAVEVLDAGKHVHIEKPHVVTLGQLHALVAGMARNPGRLVFLGFSRPLSDHFSRLREHLRKESGPCMINCFVAGHAIADGHWYFNESEGGRILGNLCHWSDLTLQIVGIENAFPCRIVPTSAVGAKSDFVTAVEFADGSLAAITFSAKGHVFDGVRETIIVHRGDLLAEIKDFKSTSIMRGARRFLFRTRFRDHGHKANIVNSYRGAKKGEVERAATVERITATAEFFLNIRQAHNDHHDVVQERRLLRPQALGAHLRG